MIGKLFKTDYLDLGINDLEELSGTFKKSKSTLIKVLEKGGWKLKKDLRNKLDIFELNFIKNGIEVVIMFFTAFGRFENKFSLYQEEK